MIDFKVIGLLNGLSDKKLTITICFAALISFIIDNYFGKIILKQNIKRVIIFTTSSSLICSLLFLT